MSGAGKRIALLAAAAIVSGAASGLLLVQAFEDARDTDDDDGVAGQLAGAGDRATAVVDALIEERDRISLDLTPAGDLVDERSLSLATTPEAREATDRSIAELTSSIGGSDTDVATLYRPALDALDGLAPLRSEIDARPDPGSMANVEYANQTFQRYDDLATLLSDAVGEGLTRSTDDPALRQGLILGHTASVQSDTISSLVQTLLLVALTGGLDEQDEIAAVAELRARFTSAADTIRAIDRSPYRELVDASFPEQLTTDITTTVDAALAGEPIEAQSIVTMVDVPIDQSYLGLEQRARDETRRHAERLADDRRTADPEDVLWLAGAVLAGLVAVAALVGVFVTAARRSPPLGPARWPPPPPVA